MAIDYAELRRSLDTDLESFAIGHANQETIAKAVGYWTGYPTFIEAYGFANGKLSVPTGKNGAYCSLNAVHEAAATFLVGVAHSYGIDGSALAVSAALCRRLYYENPALLRVDRVSDSWPECLGSDLDSLSDAQQTTILDSAAALHQLNAATSADRRSTIAAYPGSSESIDAAQVDWTQFVALAKEIVTRIEEGSAQWLRETEKLSVHLEDEWRRIAPLSPWPGQLRPPAFLIVSVDVDDRIKSDTQIELIEFFRLKDIQRQSDDLGHGFGLLYCTDPYTGDGPHECGAWTNTRNGPTVSEDFRDTALRCLRKWIRAAESGFFDETVSGTDQLSQLKAEAEEPERSVATDRKPKTPDAVKDELVRRLLGARHLEGKDEDRVKPYSTREIEKELDQVSASTAGRILKSIFGSNQAYKESVKTGTVAVYLKGLNELQGAIGTIDPQRLAQMIESRLSKSNGGGD